jgi:hypothetical protein
VERGVEIARLFDLGLTLPMLLVQGGSAHAIAGRAAEMEAAIEQAARLSGDHPDMWTVAWGHCRAFRALLEEDRPRAYKALLEAREWSQRPECGIPGAFHGFMALVATLDDADGTGGASTREELRQVPGMVINTERALLGYADAVALGRAGRGQEAAALVLEMDNLLRTKERFEGWQHLGRRLLGRPGRLAARGLAVVREQGPRSRSRRLPRPSLPGRRARSSPAVGRHSRPPRTPGPGGDESRDRGPGPRRRGSFQR